MPRLTLARPVWAALIWAVLTAGIGGGLTIIGPWYYALEKPIGQPPDWAFGPAWTIIFGLAATAAVLAWNDALRVGQRRCLVWNYAINGVVNAAWSGLFFFLQRPDWALWEVILLLLSILSMILAIRPYSRRAARLLIPYLLWVSYAAYLNYGVVALNGPFG